MKSRLLITTFFLSCLLAASALANVSTRLPHVKEEMTQASFWLKRMGDADRVLLTADEITSLNHRMVSLEPSAAEVPALPETLPGLEVHRRIQADLIPFRNRSLYTWDSSGQTILFGMMELELLKDDMRLKEIPKEVGVRFGLIVHHSNLRGLPFKEGIFEQKGDRDFDLAQQTRLTIGTPVAVLWESKGGEWLYLVSSLLQGWVESSSVGFFENRQALQEYLFRPFLVVTAPLLRYERVWKTIHPPVTLTMGTVLHGYRKHGTVYLADYPVRGEKGALSFRFLPLFDLEGIQEGFLPFTRANIVRQAFALEGMPYGWGDLRGGYDCSGFLHAVFQTMGVQLPRNSTPQSKVGNLLTEFSEETKLKAKEEILDSVPVATTFLKLDGHIMLYLGEVSGRHYVIHATSGYQSRQVFRDKEHRVMAVVVSDLSLGEGGRKGSLLKRIVSMNSLGD